MPRTAKDEYKLDEELRREESVKTEVIIELRNFNKALIEDNVRLLESLIEAQGALRHYRVAALEQNRRVINQDAKCVPGCRRHVWTSERGWEARNEPCV